MSTRTYERRLTRWLDAADHVADVGESWYAIARGDCRRMARESGCTLAVAAGVVAAYSPRMLWNANLTVARRALAGDVRGMAPVVSKVRRILAGERPLDVLSGPKVRRFYRAIMGDPRAVVIDRWIARAMGVPPEGVSALYATLESVVVKVADGRGLTPAAVQATVWVAIRGKAD